MLLSLPCDRLTVDRVKIPTHEVSTLVQEVAAATLVIFETTLPKRSLQVVHSRDADSLSARTREGCYDVRPQ